MEEEKKYRILIVDDDDFVSGMYSLKFGKAGMDVEVSPSSIEALTKLREGSKPDILILDVIMPDMNGIELLRSIREEKLADYAIIVMLTNQGDAGEIEQAKEIGIHGYIVKATTIPSEVVSEVLKIAKANGK